MKYILGSIIISFGFILVAVILMISLSVQMTETSMKYLGLAWLVLTIVLYPLAKKMVRD